MKDLAFAELFELYGKLLTEQRKKIAYDYYMCDLSMGEIAEETGLTRQGVNDCLKKTREQLSEFEKKLCLKEKCCRIINALGDVDGQKIVSIIKD